MSEQLTFFASASPEPEGLRYTAEFVSAAAERELIARIAALPLRPFQFGQYEGKRRVASFGFQYDYTLRRLQDADPIPDWLDPLIAQVEAFGGPETRIGQVLCTEYDTGVGIGWHRDKPHFDRVFGLSLGSLLQLQVPQADREEVAALHAGGAAALALHDVRRRPAGLGTQHSRRRGATVFDHIPHHGRAEILTVFGPT